MSGGTFRRSTSTRRSFQRVEWVLVTVVWTVGVFALGGGPQQTWAPIVGVAAGITVLLSLSVPMNGVQAIAPRVQGVRRATSAAGLVLVIAAPIALNARIGINVLDIAVLSALTWLLLAVLIVVEPLSVSNGLPLLRSDLRRTRHPLPLHSRAAKRCIDLVLASAIFVVTLPILVVTALAIWLGDPGPVLFSQDRIGRDGKAFRMWKFRSMVTDAEDMRHRLEGRNERNGPLFKVSRDPRVTRIGGMIRHLSIDELPQLVNVFRGQMSIVGPRPALEYELALFDEEHRSRRLLVKPGLTGLWQAEARRDPDFERCRTLDIAYVDRWTLGSDIWIVAATFIEVVIGVAGWPLSHLGIHLTSGEHLAADVAGANPTAINASTRTGTGTTDPVVVSFPEPGHPPSGSTPSRTTRPTSNPRKAAG